MADKNFIVKNGLEVGGQEVVSSSGVVTSAALGGQTLASTDSPTFNNLTLTNDIAVGGDLNLTGDLNITGDVNSLSVTDLDVTDQTITLGAGQVESASGGSGIIVDGSGASILWDETNDEWDFNKSITVTGRTLVSDDQTNDWIKQEVSGTTSTISLGNTESTGGTAQWSYSRSTGSLSGNIGAAAGTNFMTVLGTGNIGFGTDSPDGKVHIFSSSAGTVTAANDANDLVLESSANVGISLLTGNSSIARIRFGDADANARGNIFYNHNTDSFGFQTAGSTKLTLTQDGELGVGYTNPNANLHIGSATATGDATNPALQIGGASTYRLGMYTTAEGGVIDNANGDDGLQFHTKNAGEAVRITADGNLQMIAQTSSFASPGFTYHTNNYLYCRGGSAGLILSDDSGINTVQIIDGSAGYINFETGDGSSRMRINSSRIEIDPTNDRYKFTYDGTSFNEGLRMAPHSNEYSILVLGAGTGDSGSVDGQWTIARYPDADNNKFAIRHQSDNNAFTILKSGNVGIGVDTPSQKLEVDGRIKLGGMILQNTVGGGSIGFNRNPADGSDISGLSLRRFQLNGPGTTSGDFWEFQSYNSSGTHQGNIRIQDGKLGIGTTPSYKLDITATIGDQSPLLRGTASNTSTSNFNWISEFLMPNLSGGHRVVHAIGTARSNGNAATVGFFEHASAPAYNAFNVGIFGNNDILSVCYNGNVGIKTQTPDSTLTVNGTIECLKDDFNSSSEGGHLILRAPSSVSSSKRFNIDTFALSGASTMRFFSEDDSNGANGAVHMYIKANGYVGINTVPNYQLDVRGQNSGTNGHTAYIENNGGGGNGCTFSVQNTDGNHSWGVVQELRIQNGSGTDNPSILFSSGTESTNTWTVGYGYTDVNFRIKRDHGYHNGGWGTALFTMDRSGNVTIGGSLTENSDERLKENIVTIPNALDKVSQLRGVTFDWKERDDEGNVKSSMGLIAQEVEAVEGLEVLVTEVAKDGSPEMEEFQPKGVTYQNMVGLLIEAIKELKTENNDLKSRLDEAGL